MERNYGQSWIYRTFSIGIKVCIILILGECATCSFFYLRKLAANWNISEFRFRFAQVEFMAQAGLFLQQNETTTSVAIRIYIILILGEWVRPTCSFQGDDLFELEYSLEITLEFPRN